MEDEISILVIEDEVLIAETVRLMLQDFGYHIANVCYDFETALDAIRKMDYDLVLTDINLGDGVNGRSGFALIRELKKIHDCPFIFLTAFYDKDTIQTAAAMRPSAYLAKPVNAANLYASVQLAVENFRNNELSVSGEKLPSPDYIYIKVGKRMIRLLWSDVYYLESVKNYVMIRTPEYENGLPIRSSLLYVIKNMIPEDQQDRFVKISRSVAIDRSIIRSVADQNLHTHFGIFKCSPEFLIQHLKS